MYNAGLNGVEAEKAKGKYAAMLTPEQRYTAYNAGLEDARAQVARENADVASVTTTAGQGWRTMPTAGTSSPKTRARPRR